MNNSDVKQSLYQHQHQNQQLNFKTIAASQQWKFSLLALVAHHFQFRQPPIPFFSISKRCQWKFQHRLLVAPIYSVSPTSQIHNPIVYSSSIEEPIAVTSPKMFFFHKIVDKNEHLSKLETFWAINGLKLKLAKNSRNAIVCLRHSKTSRVF